MSAGVLGLAMLVCREASEMDPTYAPIHNTAGLVQLGLGDVSAALEEFATAVKLDPSLFEAHLNLAAERLAIRDFAGAEEAYRHAVALRANDYDAHLGLAVARRGRLDAGASAKPADVDQVLAELEVCKRLAEDRPEAYYNSGLLLADLARWSSGDMEKAGRARAASAAFEMFLTKPLQPGHDEQRRRAHEAIEDLRSWADAKAP
jgi:tetratricopeptide (TPR) repeat protein